MRRANPGTRAATPRADSPERVPAAERAAQHVRQLLFSGALRAGDRVDQNEIASELGISRQPVREAVLELASDGLLLVRPHHGVFVGRFDAETVRGHYELNGYLEAYAAAKVSVAADPATIERLGDLHQQFLATRDPVAAQAAVTEFYRTINVAAGNRPIALFELAVVYLPSGEQLPEERWRVGGIAEGGYEAARDAVEALHRALRIELVAERAESPALHPGKAARCAAGWWGEAHPTLLEGSWGIFELDVEALTASVPDRVLYEDVITYPANLQDIAVVVGDDVEAGVLVAAVREAGGPELRTAEVFDVYVGDQVPAGKKSVAVHLAFQSFERTLTDDEVAGLRGRIVDALAERFDAELRG